MRVSLFAASLAVVYGQDVFLSQEIAETDAAASQRLGSKHSCVNKCLATDKEKHFKKCNHDGSSSCADSKCCELESSTCFVKNAYWSACTKKCKTGIPDSLGETWDCTALSPSSCKSLKPCVEGCWGSSSESLGLEGNATAGSTWDCSNFEDKADCILHHHVATDEDLNNMWKKICNANCPDTAPKVCPASSFTKCISNCAGDSLAPEHGKSCEKDGASSCLSSKCCKNPSDKCYTKNQYWAACTSTCKKGKINPIDNQVWDCKKLKPRKTCDPYLYRSCVSTCSSQC